MRTDIETDGRLLQALRLHIELSKNMNTTQLVEQMQRTADIDELKSSIENLLSEGYTMLVILRNDLLGKKLTIDRVKEIELFFESNKLMSIENILPDKYLTKYLECLAKFWDSYIYHRGTQRSKGKFNLFLSMQTEDLLKTRALFDDECAKVLRTMEDYWVASNQVYTKYKINQIIKTYSTYRMQQPGRQEDEL